MMDRDDDLDRMLAALPLEEPPATLHGRIMGATVYAPATSAPSVSGWEIWMVGILAAAAVWLSWLVLSVPNATQRLIGAAVNAVQAAGLASPETLLWLAAGASTAWWISAITIPRDRRIRVG